MEGIRHFQRRYCSGALTTAILIGIGGYLAGWPTVTRGILLGSLFSCFNFALLGQRLHRRLTGTYHPGRLRNLVTQMWRCLLWAVPLVIAVQWPAVDLPSTVVGLFMVPAGIIMEAVIGFVRRSKSPLA